MVRAKRFTLRQSYDWSKSAKHNRGREIWDADITLYERMSQRKRACPKCHKGAEKPYRLTKVELGFGYAFRTRARAEAIARKWAARLGIVLPKPRVKRDKP